MVKGRKAAHLNEPCAVCKRPQKGKNMFGTTTPKGRDPEYIMTSQEANEGRKTTGGHIGATGEPEWTGEWPPVAREEVSAPAAALLDS